MVEHDRQGHDPPEEADDHDGRAECGERDRDGHRPAPVRPGARPLWLTIRLEIIRTESGIVRPTAREIPIQPARHPEHCHEVVPMSKLSEPEILARLPMAKGWERHGDMLVRTWQFPSFRRAMEFVNQVAAADREDRSLSGPDRELSHRPDRDLDPRCRRVDRSRFRADRRHQRDPDRSLSRNRHRTPPRIDRCIASIRTADDDRRRLDPPPCASRSAAIRAGRGRSKRAGSRALSSWLTGRLGPD